MIHRFLLVVIVAVALAWLLLAPWIYTEVDAPRWCEIELMRYSRGCIGWTVFENHP